MAESSVVVGDGCAPAPFRLLKNWPSMSVTGRMPPCGVLVLAVVEEAVVVGLADADLGDGRAWAAHDS